MGEVSVTYCCNCLKLLFCNHLDSSCCTLLIIMQLIQPYMVNFMLLIFHTSVLHM